MERKLLKQSNGEIIRVGTEAVEMEKEREMEMERHLKEKKVYDLGTTCVA